MTELRRCPQCGEFAYGWPKRSLSFHDPECKHFKEDMMDRAETLFNRLLRYKNVSSYEDEIDAWLEARWRQLTTVTHTR